MERLGKDTIRRPGMFCAVDGLHRPADWLLQRCGGVALLSPHHHDSWGRLVPHLHNSWGSVLPHHHDSWGRGSRHRGAPCAVVSLGDLDFALERVWRLLAALDCRPGGRAWEERVFFLVLSSGCVPYSHGFQPCPQDYWKQQTGLTIREARETGSRTGRE